MQLRNHRWSWHSEVATSLLQVTRFFWYLQSNKFGFSERLSYFVSKSGVESTNPGDSDPCDTQVYVWIEWLLISASS